MTEAELKAQAAIDKLSADAMHWQEIERRLIAEGIEMRYEEGRSVSCGCPISRYLQREIRIKSIWVASDFIGSDDGQIPKETDLRLPEVIAEFIYEFDKRKRNKWA